MEVVNFWESWSDLQAAGNATPAVPGASLVGTISNSNYTLGQRTFYAVYNSDPTTEYLQYSFTSSGNRKICIAFWTARYQATTTQTVPFQFFESDNTPQHTITTETNGDMSFRLGGSGGTVLATVPVSNFPIQAPVHVEAVIDIHDSAGSVNVYINGAASPVATFSGDTRNGGTAGRIDYFRYSGHNNTTVQYVFRDFLLRSDFQGSEPVPYGIHRVASLVLNGNGTDTAWTGTSGDWDALRDAGITSTTNGAREAGLMTDLSDAISAGDVKIVKAAINMIDLGTPGTGSIKVGLRSNAGTYYGLNDLMANEAGYQPSVSGEIKEYFFKKDPATQAVWDPATGRANLNAAQIVVESVIT